MFETIDEITIEYREGDDLLVEELDKEVLTRGSWTTILFRYRDRRRPDQELSAPKATIRRYQKRDGSFRKQSHFNISNGRQARQISQVLLRWFPEEEG